MGAWLSERGGEFEIGARNEGRKSLHRMVTDY